MLLYSTPVSYLSTGIVLLPKMLSEGLLEDSSLIGALIEPSSEPVADWRVHGTLKSPLIWK